MAMSENLEKRARFLFLLQFARQLRKHLNKPKPKNWGASLSFYAKRDKLSEDAIRLVGLGYDPDIVLTRLAFGTKYPERAVLILMGLVYDAFPLMKPASF
jgi:hypothetical protein